MIGMTRRHLLRGTAAAASVVSPGPLANARGSEALAGAPPGPAAAQTGKFRISLAEWSLHKAIESRLIANLDFPRIAREQFGIEGLEFVNALWQAPTGGYVRDLKRNMTRTGTKAVLIMVDEEGDM